jgi:hypothetical protein
MPPPPKTSSVLDISEGRKYTALAAKFHGLFFFLRYFSPHLDILSALLYSTPVLHQVLLIGSALVAASPLLAALLLWSLPDPFITAWLVPHPVVTASILGRRLSRSSPHHPSSPSLIFAYKVNISIRNIQT